MSRLAGQAVFTIVGTAAQGLVRVGIPVLVGRSGEPTDLANVTLVLSVCVLLSMAWPTPAGTVLSRYLGLGADAAAAARSTLVRSVAIALPLLGVVAGATIAVLTGELMLAGFAVILTVAYSAYYFSRGNFLGELRAAGLARWECVGAVIALAGAVAAVLAGWPTGALLAIALGYALIAIVGWPRRAGRGTDRSILAFTAHNALANAASNGMIQLAVVVVFALAPSIETALFAAAFSLATPTSMVGQALNQVLIPHLAAARSDGTPTRTIARGALLLTAITVLAFALAFVLGEWIMTLVYGIEYANASSLLRVLLVAMLLFTLSLYPAAALTAWGLARRFTSINLTSLVVGLTAMLILTAVYGTSGAAFGLAIGTGCLLVATTTVAIRHLTTPGSTTTRPTRSEPSAY